MVVPRDITHKRTTEDAASYDPDTRRRHEHLDGFVHHSIDRMARRLHGIPRGRRIDSPAAGVRGHFPDTPLRSGKTSRLTRTSRYQRDGHQQGAGLFCLKETLIIQ